MYCGLKNYNLTYLLWSIISMNFSGWHRWLFGNFLRITPVDPACFGGGEKCRTRDP
jgi:hypothetical protein